jgi:N-hydroxyarylamine O-acetyltransferase
VDVKTYLDRIGYQGDIKADIESLRRLHHLHLLAVPFENLDIHLGRSIVLDSERLYEKIVLNQRGGFCYELNGLFAELLLELGFEVQRLSARVAKEQGGYGIPFDHMTLLVKLKQNWLADVGFGDSYREPLLLNVNGIQKQAGESFRLLYDGTVHTYLRRVDGVWKPQYIFSRQPYDLADFKAGCNYHQTSPKSSFTQRRVCSLATPDGRVTLSDMKLITTVNGRREERDVVSEEEYIDLLREYFGVVL